MCNDNHNTQKNSNLITNSNFYQLENLKEGMSMVEKHIEDKLNILLDHIEDKEKKDHYFRLILTLLEKGYFPGLAEVPVVKSSISHIDGDRGLLTYRGYPVEELAKECSFEAVCYLVLNGDLPVESEEAELREKLLTQIYLNDDLKKSILSFNPLDFIP